MEPQHHRTRILRVKSVLRDLAPDGSSGAKLCDLLEKIVVGVEEERESGSKDIEVDASGQRRLHVSNRIRKRERKLVNGSRTCFPDVITADRYRVPIRKFHRTVLDHVGDQTQGKARRIDIRATRN